MSYAPGLRTSIARPAYVGWILGRQGETVDREFTTAKEVAEATLCFAAAKTSALKVGRFVNHGWFME